MHEETGFDLSDWINPEDKLTITIRAQVVTMFLVGGIPEDTIFATQTRNEIGVSCTPALT